MLHGLYVSMNMKHLCYLLHLLKVIWLKLQQKFNHYNPASTTFPTKAQQTPPEFQWGYFFIWLFLMDKMQITDQIDWFISAS